MKKQLLISIIATFTFMNMAVANDNDQLLAPAKLPSYANVHNQMLKGNSDAEPKVYALSINGVETTEKEARDNLLALKEASKVTTYGGYLNWDVVYNPTAEPAQYLDNKEIEAENRHRFVNIWDVIYHQKNNEISFSNMKIDDYVTGLLHGKKYDPDVFELLKEYATPDYAQLLKNYSGKNIDTVIDHFHQTVPMQFAAVLQRIKGEQNSDIRDYSHVPAAVLLLPHSQGNLYANELRKYLVDVEKFNPRHIATFGIATPAATNDGDWPVSNPFDGFAINGLPYAPSSYITSCNDDVINLLRNTEVVREVLGIFNLLVWGKIEVPGVAKCNISATDYGKSDNRHSLVDYYLTISELREHIAININYYLYQLNIQFLNDIVSSMLPFRPDYNRYPRTATMVVGYSADTKNQSVGGYYSDRGGSYYPDWASDYNYEANKNMLMGIRTPILESYANKANSIQHINASSQLNQITHDTKILDMIKGNIIYGKLVNFAILPSKYYDNYASKYRFYITQDITKPDVGDYAPLQIFPFIYNLKAVHPTINNVDDFYNRSWFPMYDVYNNECEINWMVNMIHSYNYNFNYQSPTFFMTKLKYLTECANANTNPVRSGLFEYENSKYLPDAMFAYDNH